MILLVLVCNALDDATMPLVQSRDPEIPYSVEHWINESEAILEIKNENSRGVLDDEKNADGYCGSKKYVNTCGFPNIPAWCFTSVSTGAKQCIHGLCVCTQLAGCKEPTCTTNAKECTGQALCTGGCITAAGSGWECWHP